MDETCIPLLALAEASPTVPLNLHFSGSLLHFARDQRPEFIERLRHLIKDGRVELLGGAFHDPVLSSIPERDAKGQLVFASNFMEEHLGRRPRGAWLSLSAWDSSVIAPLADSGIHYSLVDAEAFHSVGLDPWEVHGYFSTERHGRAIALFPIDNSLSSAAHELDASALAASFERVARRPQPPSLVVLALDAEQLVGVDAHGALFDCLRDNLHWLKPRLLGAYWESTPSRGGVYLGQSAWPALAPWCRPTWSGALDDSEVSAAPVVWENVLSRYAESNRIHKRMLRVSERIDTLRQVLARQHRKGKNISGAKKLLEKACAALWRAQSHDVYWHGGPLNLGIYDPKLRSAALRDLMTAEKVVNRVLSGREPSAWEELPADYDGDGSEEVLVRTSSLQAIVDPGSGGGLFELDLRDQAVALLSGLDPIREPYHQAPSGTEVQLVVEGQDRAESEDEPQPEVVPALDRLSVGRLRRGAFLDHFLGPETTISSFARGQYREVGDFADARYQLVTASNGGGDGEVTVGRSGVVKKGEESSLLRVEKTYRFDLEHPRLTVVHRTSNRSRDPASGWFGLEWTFGLPSGSADGVTLKVQTAEGPGSHRLAEGPVEIPPCSWLEWEDAEAGLAIVMELDVPHSLWWIPISTVARGPAGWREDTQGNTLLFHAPTDVWGGEEQRFELKLAFLSG